MIEPFYSEPYVQIYQGDVREVLHSLPAESVQTVITSPPYLGKRQYTGDQSTVWSGSEGCQHSWEGKKGPEHPPLGRTSALHERASKAVAFASQYSVCSKCGAIKCAFGLEPDAFTYVLHTIEILREIRRVLRPDGVCFWNIGDSFAGNVSRASFGGRAGFGTPREGVFTRGGDNLKPKDLCLIPFHIAIEAQRDGWWIRSVIIWNKPDTMPQSVTDRPTNSYEYILMLTKKSKYYWDQEAVREPHKDSTLERIKYGWHGDPEGPSFQQYGNLEVMGQRFAPEGGRNLRDVWTFNTESSSQEHYAVFPEKLPELCIRAATPEVGCCSRCGKPWARLTEKGKIIAQSKSSKYEDRSYGGNQGYYGDGEYRGIIQRETKTIGWEPQCKCNTSKTQSVVLDPFAGTGTTLAVAKKLGRRAIGIDISKQYCEMAKKRVEGVSLPMEFNYVEERQEQQGPIQLELGFSEEEELPDF